MTKTSKKLTILLLIAGLSLAVSACIKKPAPTNQNSNQNQDINTNQAGEIDTSEWKTYRNEEYGFEFKYPEELSIEDWSYKTPNWELLLYIGQNRNIGDGVISIGIEKGKNRFDGEKVFWPIPREDIAIADAVIGVGNYSVKEVVVNFHSVDGDVNTLNYFIENSGKLFRITYNLNRITELKKNIFEAVLSSFTFIQ